MERRPPEKIINPTQMVRDGRYSESNNQQRQFSFGDAMDAISNQPRTTPSHVFSRQIYPNNSNSDSSDEEDTSEEETSDEEKISEEIISNTETGELFYYNGEKYVPLIINKPPSPRTTKQYVATSIENNFRSINYTERTEANTAEPQISGILRGNQLDRLRELNENNNGKHDNKPSTNNMNNPNTTGIPQIPLPTFQGPSLGRTAPVIPNPQRKTGNSNMPVVLNSVQQRTPVIPQRVPMNARVLKFNNTNDTETIVSPSEPGLPDVPVINPYIKLSRPILDNIATERDITLTGSNVDRANQLFEYDHIMPDWIQSIMMNDIDTFQTLAGTKLYVFGALNGVDYSNLPGLNNRDITNYTRVCILMNTPNHPARGVLPGLIGSLSRNILEIFAVKMGIPHGHLRFISLPELRTAVVSNNTSHIPIDSINNVVRRYHLLKDHKYSQLIDDLYNINDDETAWVNVSRSEPTPMENVILNLDNFTDAQLIETFGMAVPISWGNNVRRYIVNNIVLYNKVLTRGKIDPIPIEVCVFMRTHDIIEYISKLTDREIFEHTGVYVPYNSRAELVTNIVTTITRQQFMYPSSRSLARSQNKETLMMTDITDIGIFMICYGTALKYYVYELEELINAFHRDEETRIMEFRRPENFNLKFSHSDIECLLQLLQSFPPTGDIIALIKIINDGLIDAREKIAHDDIARRQLLTFDKSSQVLIRDFLHQLFIVGMYMRKWKGPGHPYPLTKASTQNTHGKPNEEIPEKVPPELVLARELLWKMTGECQTFCMNLKLCEYNSNGGIDHGMTSLENEWKGVIKGENCIRMASTRFIGTSLHYLRALYHENIPGIDVKALDRIF